MSRQRRTNKASYRKRPSDKTDMGELRLIGGQWKRSVLKFPLLPGVRPTPSRVRETLFNWLSSAVPGSHCLDLFAGSGALGLEALSRGATSCTFVDQQRLICEQLEQHVKRLGASQASVIQGDAMAPQQLSFAENREPEIVFVDPPFNQGLVAPFIDALHQAAWIKHCQWLYLETEAQIKTLNTPENWSLQKEKIAGDVCYRLYSIK